MRPRSHGRGRAGGAQTGVARAGVTCAGVTRGVTRAGVSQTGVTLVELMVVLVIVAVLAAVAVVAYSGYIRRSRASEAVLNLQLVATAQETYRNEFGQYAAATDWNPGTIACGAPAQWDETIASWQQLGFRPDKRTVYFQYSAEAGRAAPAPPLWADTFIPASTRSLGWYALTAQSDMDCTDGTMTTYRMVNTRSDVVVRDNEYE